MTPASKIASPQDYRIAAIFRLGAAQPLSRRFIETKLVEFGGMSISKAQQLAGHWFGTQAFKAVRA